MAIDVNEKQQALIKQLVEMPDDQAIKVIREKVSGEVGPYGAEAVAAAQHNLIGLVEQYKKDHALQVTGFADVLVREKIAGTLSVDAQGNTSYGVSGQMHAKKVGDANLFVGAAINVDQTGVKGGSAWVNPIGGPIDVGDAHVIPVSQAKLMVDEKGQVSGAGMVGAVINPDETKANIAVLASGTADGKNADVFVDYSHDIQLGKGVVATPHAGVTQQFMGEQGTSLSGGLRVHDKHAIDSTTGLAFEVGATSTNLREQDPSFKAFAQVEVTFNNPKEEKQSSLEQAFVNATIQEDRTETKDLLLKAAARDVIQAPAANSAVRSDLNANEKTVDALINSGKLTQGINEALKFYNQLAHDPKSQQAFITHIADNMAQKSSMFKDTVDAQQYLQRQFDNQNYLNQHNQQIKVASLDR